MPARPFLVAVVAVAAGCGGDGAAGPDAGGTCSSDERTADQVYYGSAQPTYAPLTAGQVLAVGAWTGSAQGGEIFCSGTLIAPSWVLTAAHCGIRVGDFFCFGAMADAPVGCLAVAEVRDSPVVTVDGSAVTLDMAIARLGADATTMIDGVEPIPVIVEDAAVYVGEMIETAGYGRTEANTSGTRLFALELFADIGVAGPGFLTVDGMGQRGVCYGDSGGPALVIDAAGAARLAGTLSGGESSCVGRDNFTRADLALTWIEQFTGPTPVAEGGPCGPTLDDAGRCSGDRALWCEAGVVAAEECPDGQTCGWDGGSGGFRCITGPDPCGGVDRIGGCDGAIARWCDDGAPRARDCACLEQLCTIDGTLGGAYCIDDPCMGLDFLGRCNGDVAEWCGNGTPMSEDCAAMGQTCGYVDDEVGYYCM